MYGSLHSFLCKKQTCSDKSHGYFQIAKLYMSAVEMEMEVHDLEHLVQMLLSASLPAPTTTRGSS